VVPAVIFTLSRNSLGRFRPGARICGAHGTTAPADPATGARDATVFAMYHPAAALRTTAIEEQSYRDIEKVPGVLLEARARRATTPDAATAAEPVAAPDRAPISAPDATLFQTT
jgi:hypothetical protein